MYMIIHLRKYVHIFTVHNYTDPLHVLCRLTKKIIVSHYKLQVIKVLCSVKS